jgi:transposase
MILWEDLRMRIAPSVRVSLEDKRQLEAYARGRSTPARLMQRAKIVLLAAEGKENREIAVELGIMRHTVGRWRSRFARLGLSGIQRDAPRSGRLPTLSQELVLEIVRKTTQETPADATHWSTRSMAKAVGVSASTVRRVWRRHGLKPHRVRTFKLSNDRRFVEKMEDVIALYLNPPEHALVLCADEKSQIQALDRTQPGLPIKKGRCGTMTHDYKRNGTTTLFAALSTLDGKVIASCMPRHRHQEWLKFLKQIDRETPVDKEIHLIADNYSTHKHPVVLRWLARHSRFHLHFTPTSASWLNMVERFLRDLTEKQISRGVFRSVDQLEETILRAIEQHNAHPKPFIWTAKASDILEKVKRARLSLNKVASA